MKLTLIDIKKIQFYARLCDTNSILDCVIPNSITECGATFMGFIWQQHMVPQHTKTIITIMRTVIPSSSIFTTIQKVNQFVHFYTNTL